MTLQSFQHKQLFLVVLLVLNLSLTQSQNTCSPSSTNDKIFVGSSTLAPGIIKPGINTFSMANGVIETLVPAPSTYNASKLQIAQSFRNFASSIQKGGYEMRDFSFHSVFLTSTQIRFLFLWNEQSTINVTISMSIQFLLTYDREEFLMGSFVIDPVEFLLKQLNQNAVNYSRNLRFKDLNALTTIPNQSSSLSVNTFIVGLRYFGQGINIRLANESYNIISSELTFTIQRSNSTLQGLSLVHISYVIFDRTILAPQFRMFFSLSQLGSQDKIDYWMKGIEEVNFKEFQTGNVAMTEFYFYKINRLRCSQGCSGCVSIQNCQRIQGIAINDTDCIVCPAGTRFNPQTLMCDSQTTCRSTEVWNGTQCICQAGLVRVNSQCIQCPQNTTYNSLTQLCDLKCDQNSILTTSNQCICKQGYNIIDGKCSLCPANTTYDSTSRRCLLICTAVQIYNQASQRCECISGLQRINGTCGRCANGFIYDSATQTCTFNCGTNQGFINGTCRCLDGFVIILGACSKCPSGTIYNSLLQTCVPSCTGNRRILNGKCVCNDGAYEIGNQCGTCPQGSTYNSVSKACDSAGITCKQNQLLFNGVCTCSGPYVNSICQPCSTNLVWNATAQQCILRCPANSLYNSAFKACVCNAGFFVIGDTCGVCPSGTVYDFGTRSCQNGRNCTGANEIFYLGLCICNVGFLRIRGNCSTCPSGTIYNETIFDCQLVCGLNQTYNSSSLRCDCNSLSGFFRINNICQQCPSGTIFNQSSSTCQNACPSGQIFTNGRCSCPSGFNLIGTTCGLCDVGTVYNASALKCDRACPDINGYFQNGRCFCYPPYVVVNQTNCQLCPANTTYDISSLSCRSLTPSNNDNLTCNTTSQIRKLNISTGLYYCECDQAKKYYLIYDSCGSCQMFTKYNPETKSCELDVSLLLSSSVFYFDPQNSMKVGGSLSASNCSNKDNKVLTNGVCRCISTAIRYGTQCVVCPANSSPNSQQTACQCNSQYQLSLIDYTCRLNNQSSSVQNSSNQCPANQIWNRNQCTCVEEFYKINGTCIKCPIFSAFNGSTCVCQFNYFPQSLNSLNIPSSCQSCHSSCSSCTGSSSSQCLSCANISSILRNGQCISQNCSIGFYLVVYSANLSKCQKCSAYCKSCVSNIDCTECVDGFSVYSHQLTPTLSVKVCSQICGDGKRFERNCDDGNAASGDGCNKDCEVEAGWTCVGGTTTSGDVCSLTTPAPKAIIVVMNATIERGFINQNIRLTYIPDFFLKTDCSLCSNLFKITVTQAKIIPDSIRITYIPKSKYQFSIEFKFSDILTIPIFKFGVQLNPEYKQYFTEWDMAQWYDMEVNSVLLSRKNSESYLRENEIQ